MSRSDRQQATMGKLFAVTLLFYLTDLNWTAFAHVQGTIGGSRLLGY